MITIALMLAIWIYLDPPVGITVAIALGYLYWRERRRDYSAEDEAPFPTWFDRLCFTRGYIRSALAGETPSLVSQLISSQRVFLMIAVFALPYGYFSYELKEWLGIAG